MELKISGEQLLAALADPAFVVDGHGRIRHANALAHEQFGYESPALIGQPVEVLVPEPFRAQHPTRRATYSRAPQHRFGDTRGLLTGVRLDGSAFPVQITLAPLATAVGPMTLALVHDLSELIEHEEMLRQTKLEHRKAIDRAEDALSRHDALAQSVFGLTLAIDALSTTTDPEAQRRGLTELSTTLHRLITELNEEGPST